MSNKIGRNLQKCKFYKDRKIREYNKLKRILRSNGVRYAKKWAKDNGVTSILEGMMKGKDYGNFRLRKPSS